MGGLGIFVMVMAAFLVIIQLVTRQEALARISGNFDTEALISLEEEEKQIFIIDNRVNEDQEKMEGGGVEEEREGGVLRAIAEGCGQKRLIDIIH